MKPFSRIVPYTHIQQPIDKYSHAKFRASHTECAHGTASKEGSAGVSCVDLADHRKAKSTRNYHARMGISAPENLHQSVANTAKQAFPSHARHGIRRQPSPEAQSIFIYGHQAFPAPPHFFPFYGSEAKPSRRQDRRSHR